MATTVEQFSTATGELTIYRDDPADAPTRVNQDRYLVWTDLPSHRSYEQIATGVGLDKDQAARGYLRDNVLIVKQDPGPEHWLSAVPSNVQVLLKSVESTKSD
jgi:hypothetical protein